MSSKTNTKKPAKTTSAAQTQTNPPAGVPPAGAPPAGIPPVGAPPMMPPPMMQPPVVPVVPVVPLVPVAQPIPAPLPPKYPLIDRDDDENNFYVYADVPGLTLKEIKVEIKEKMLVISGERKCPFEEELNEPPKEGPELKLFPIVERIFGPFERKVPIPENVDINSHKSVVNNGVLVITFNKNQVKK